MASIQKVETRKGTGYRIQVTELDKTRTTMTVYVSRKEAEEIARKLEVKKSLIKSGLAAPPASRKPLREVVDGYLENGEQTKAYSTVVRERKAFKPLLATYGDIPLRNITADHIENHVGARLKEGVTPQGVACELRHIKALFSKQVKMGRLVKSPAGGISPPKFQQKAIRFLSKEEVEKLLEKVDDEDFKDLVLGYLNTGARRSEILKPNFTWDSVQFDLNRVKIEGKGDKVRYVPMTATLRAVLEKRRDAEKASPFDFSYSWVFKKLAKYYEDAEIENANVHTLRKTFGSLLLQQGEDIFRVSKLLGHSSVMVTQNHYADILQDDLATSVMSLDKVFSSDAE